MTRGAFSGLVYLVWVWRGCFGGGEGVYFCSWGLFLEGVVARRRSAHWGSTSVSSSVSSSRAGGLRSTRLRTKLPLTLAQSRTETEVQKKMTDAGPGPSRSSRRSDPRRVRSRNESSPRALTGSACQERFGRWRPGCGVPHLPRGRSLSDTFC